MVISITGDNRVIGYAFLDDLVCHTEKGILDKRTSTLREIPDMDKNSQEYKHFEQNFKNYVYHPETKTVTWDLPDWKRDMEGQYNNAKD